MVATETTGRPRMAGRLAKPAELLDRNLCCINVKGGNDGSLGALRAMEKSARGYQIHLAGGSGERKRQRSHLRSLFVPDQADRNEHDGNCEYPYNDRSLYPSGFVRHKVIVASCCGKSSPLAS